MKKIPNLNDILSYQNASLIRYFCHHHPEISEAEAEQLLKDLLAWLWLNAYRQKSQKKTYLFGPLLLLDEIWHAFILHTNDYCFFSEQFFGEYFHHEIEPVDAPHEIPPEDFADFVSDAIDNLGVAWVFRYFPLDQ